MKHFSKLLVVGFTGICLFAACGTENAHASNLPSAGTSGLQIAEDVLVEPDVPTTLPIVHYGVPITSLVAPQYPDRIRTDVILKDLTDDTEYNLDDVFDPDHGIYGFTVCSDHDYQLVFQLYSEGGDIGDIEFAARPPEISGNGRNTTATFFARNRTTTQDLMMAVIHFTASDGGPVFELSETAETLCTDGVYLGNLSHDSTEVVFEFHVR